jgi:aminomethyltransferase
MTQIHQTIYYERHVSLGAQMVEFAGWNMPLQYGGGIIQEHLTTRKKIGLFDVSHMGRFVIGGQDVLPFLQYVLSNNAAALEPEEGHYTLIPNEKGGVLDDAYLYRFVEDEYLLVVNASNRDWLTAQRRWPCSVFRAHLQKKLFPALSIQGNCPNPCETP